MEYFESGFLFCIGCLSENLEERLKMANSCHATRTTKQAWQAGGWLTRHIVDYISVSLYYISLSLPTGQD